eukprot:c3537_g1_i1 orf=2-199(-)
MCQVLEGFYLLTCQHRVKTTGLFPNLNACQMDSSDTASHEPAHCRERGSCACARMHAHTHVHIQAP